MKRPRFARRGALARDAEQLVWLATGLAQSESRIEDGYWEALLSERIDRHLRAGNDDALNSALDHLYRSDGRAYDECADLVEARVEGSTLSSAQGDLDAVLLAIPLLAWSRYRIPCASVNADLLANVRTQLCAHVFAADLRIGLADHLYSPDQLPMGYAETRALAARLAAAAAEGHDLAVDARRLPETAQYLSDMRYLLAAAVVPRGRPLFRWQEADGSRSHSEADWAVQGGAALAPAFTGCAFEPLRPDVYYAACREADRRLRPYSLRAAVAYLQSVLDVAPAGLRAVIAPFAEHTIQEYRIGLTLKSRNEVLHGVVWPLLDAEDETSDIAGQIETALGEAGVSDVLSLEHSLPVEYCEECGGPLYADPEGHVVHAEMPEQAEAPSAHLH
ncbi:MAG TPA: DUF2863 domain-containing protein [Rhodocyclaceae bacterium]|nr:MAG: hypothetical protein AUK49_08995 [Betaproteobacteria bacterium CG2_30_68_42]PIX75610.1 MAG: DUF2863 domain-containing protein [Rhodocyclales bacterium CG_4_10_14_3_um_filter_68_10]PJA57495.1 MAG: DUF2863 domain-containing protein [Rhodocyclales bacterium CG_4_9_14_3_um_filter_68_10]HCX34797.1 DUF2863 domain-containing protein [Rhodocyclaceae bacterium]